MNTTMLEEKLIAVLSQIQAEEQSRMSAADGCNSTGRRPSTV